MPLAAAYHRPQTLEDALELLTGPRRVALAGGTALNADRSHDRVEMVDLQALGLGGVEPVDQGLRVGAMTTLAELAGADSVPATIRDLARAEEPSTLRTLATIGGLIACSDPDSVLLAALLVSGGVVEFARADPAPLAEVLASSLPAGDLITAITFDPAGSIAVSGTGRTPADVPIVAAVARRDGDSLALALTGVAEHPVAASPSDPLDRLTPPDDFRGSSTYRRTLAGVHAERAMGAIR